MDGYYVDTPANSDDELIRKYVGTFHVLDDGYWTTHDEPPPDELNAGIDPADWRHLLNRPAAIKTERSALTAIYDYTPGNLPPLYERLILSWRGLEVFLHRIQLLANPPDPDLNGLKWNIFRDSVLTSHLIPNGFVPFACYSDNGIHSYDPVCFDLNRRRPDGDCPIRRFEHEAMLSFDHIGESWQLWPSCRAMMEDTIRAAADLQQTR